MKLRKGVQRGGGCSERKVCGEVVGAVEESAMGQRLHRKKGVQ